MTEWIADTFITVTALLLLVMIIRRPVSRIFGPTVAYGLWLLPAARLLMPTIEVAAEVAEEPSNLARQDLLFETAYNAANALPITPTEHAFAGATNWPHIAIILWLGIAALVFIVQMLRYCEMRDAILADAEYLRSVEDIQMIQSDQVTGPLAFGLFKRFIVVPMHFNQQYSPDEREMALAHEVAHHKSGDLFANIAAFAVLCLTWFNPVSWVCWSAFRCDQEAACDARVLEGRDKKAREVYGRTLVRTAHEPVPAFATALNSPKTIIARLRNLTMQDISKKRRRFGKAGILAAIAAALPLTATTVPVLAQDQEAGPAGTAPEKSAAPMVTNGAMVTNGTGVDEPSDSEAPHVTTIENGGQVIVLRTKAKLTTEQLARMAVLESSRRPAVDSSDGKANADAAAADPAKTIRIYQSKDGSTSKVIVHRVAAGDTVSGEKTVRIVRIERDGDKNIDINSPEGFDHDASDIDISRIANTGACKSVETVTPNAAEQKNGQSANMKLIICGQSNSKTARDAAKVGMIKALAKIKNDASLPKEIQTNVIASIQQQIDKLDQENSANK